MRNKTGKAYGLFSKVETNNGTDTILIEIVSLCQRNNLRNEVIKGGQNINVRDILKITLTFQRVSRLKSTFPAKIFAAVSRCKFAVHNLFKALNAEGFHSSFLMISKSGKHLFRSFRAKLNTTHTGAAN